MDKELKDITPGENYLIIEECFMFISSDENGEGVIGGQINGMFMPFVCADKARVDSLREYAKQIGKVGGKKIKLIRFSLREDIEDIT